MPRWMLLVVAAVVFWLTLSVIGGFLLGRLLDLAGRRRRSPQP
jgi:hypothetical protein